MSDRFHTGFTQVSDRFQAWVTFRVIRFQIRCRHVSERFKQVSDRFQVAFKFVLGR